ncbi:MAG TPA: DUF4291 domain-containing protein [Phototrophicaceae bacterium]|nr:DUF4291 domain-containing protein [Phototrophicaceae bacterium]
MSKYYEIRADYKAETIVVYQAYSPQIAVPALGAKKFVPPFSFNRMTWIKPSFLWLMERSNWGQKPNQEYILAIQLKRSGWDEALSLGVLTSYEPSIYPSVAAWQAQFEQALVHIQWDPERSLRGADLQYNSIQVGLSRQIIRQYVDEWMVDIQDYTPLTRKIHQLVQSGHADKAAKLLPPERVYPLEPAIARRIVPTSGKKFKT